MIRYDPLRQFYGLEKEKNDLNGWTGRKCIQKI